MTTETLVPKDSINTILLVETLEKLKLHDKSPADVLFVHIGDKVKAPWEQFAQEAALIEYYAGFGFEEINLKLQVVGKDWWLERREYDGEEWWAYRQSPWAQGRLAPYGVLQLREEY